MATEESCEGTMENSTVVIGNCFLGNIIILGKMLYPPDLTRLAVVDEGSVYTIRFWIIAEDISTSCTNLKTDFK